MFRAVLLALTASVIATASAGAQTSVADFYRNKNIDVYVGFSVGGVYDINARLLSRYMGRYIPGNPTLVPRNMTGAAGVTLANWLYQVAPKDGTAIGTFARGIAFNPLLGRARRQRSRRRSSTGSAAPTTRSPSACRGARAASRSLNRFSSEELVVGSTGTSGDDDQFPRIMNGVLGTKFRIVRGFPGGNEIKLAMERGEVSGRCGWSWSSVKATEAEWLKDKQDIDPRPALACASTRICPIRR